jgi:hypothetical protein
MKKTYHQKPFLLSFYIIFIGGMLITTGCSKDEVEPTNNNVTSLSYTVTVGVFILNSGTYVDQNKDFVFETQEACQSWSRTASGDNHSTSSHYHYNAAENTTYNTTTKTITWTEYGPELDQLSIDATCDNGVNGATKTASQTDFSADKNFFLKIKSVVEN